MEKQRVGLDALRPGQRGILREILMPNDAKSRMEELWRRSDEPEGN